MELFDFSGLAAAPFTPMKANGDINPAKIGEYARHLAASGVKGVFLNGTTGEGPQSLTVAERKELLEAWMREKEYCPTIIVQVGGCSYREALELAEHAESLGVSAIAVLPNLFPRPRTVAELVEWCRRISLAAPSTPLLYYHIPSFSGVSLSMVEFLQEGGKVIPTLVGLKYSSAEFQELAYMMNVRNRAGRPYKIFLGSDETLVPALALGIDSAVGSTYNFIPQVHRHMIKLYHEGGQEEELGRTQQELTQFFKEIFSFGFCVAALKPVMKLITGLDLGPPRYPYRELNQEEEQKLRDVLKESKLNLF